MWATPGTHGGGRAEQLAAVDGVANLWANVSHGGPGRHPKWAG
jgi:hypothetical protein